MNEQKEKIGFLKSLKILGRAVVISFKIRSVPSLVVCLLGFGAAVLPALSSTTLRKFTDQIQSLFGGRILVKTVFISFTLLMAVYISQAVYSFLQSSFAEIDKQRNIKFLKTSLMKCAGTVEYKYIENEERFREKLLLTEQFGGTHVAESLLQITLVLQSLVTFLCIITVLNAVNIWIVIMLLFSCIPAVILSAKQKDEEYWNKTRSIDDGGMVINLFFTAAGGSGRGKYMAEVRFSNMFDYLKAKWRTISKTYIKKKNDITKKHVLFNSIADILRNSIHIGVLLLTGYQIYKNPSIGLGTFMLVFTMTGQLQTATAKLFVGATKFLGDIRYMRDFFELLDTPKEKSQTNTVPFDIMNIEFQNVSFTYPGSNRKALNSVSVSIRQGEKIAIVGENGSGKSTFVNLLCGMYVPDSGTATVNGQTITNQLSTVRRGISAVFQNFGKYEATLKENIVISDQTKQVNEKELTELAKAVGAYDIISDCPEGFDEVVGTFSSSGNNLSGGQWQKVAIMRAAYRDKAKVMILDEPTAALDPIAEANLYENFAHLTGDKTTILISHRLGITRVVDRVLVFDSGKIVEDGSHSELIIKNGLYAKLYNAQAQWYQSGKEDFLCC